MAAVIPVLQVVRGLVARVHRVQVHLALVHQVAPVLQIVLDLHRVQAQESRAHLVGQVPPVRHQAGRVVDVLKLAAPKLVDHVLLDLIQLVHLLAAQAPVVLVLLAQLQVELALVAQRETQTVGHAVTTRLAPNGRVALPTLTHDAIPIAAQDAMTLGLHHVQVVTQTVVPDVMETADQLVTRIVVQGAKILALLVATDEMATQETPAVVALTPVDQRVVALILAALIVVRLMTVHHGRVARKLRAQRFPITLLAMKFTARSAMNLEVCPTV